MSFLVPAERRRSRMYTNRGMERAARAFDQPRKPLFFVPFLFAAMGLAESAEELIQPPDKPSPLLTKRLLNHVGAKTNFI